MFAFGFVDLSKIAENNVSNFVANNTSDWSLPNFNIKVPKINFPKIDIGAGLARAFSTFNFDNDEVPMVPEEGFEEDIDDEYERFPGNDPSINNINEIPAEFILDEKEKIPEEGKIIIADLEQMRLQIYEDGKELGDFKILSKGRQGTAWETPPGKFEVKYKTANHFSSIGRVWMPYSMQFFGNYFIHGWPYYPDGTPVPEGYSGGCIRLADEDMEQIFNFSDVGTEIMIRGSKLHDESEIKTGHYENLNKTSFPQISSQSYVVADLETGEIIKQKNKGKIYPIASLSKLMTALVSLDTVNQYNQTLVSASAVATYGKQGSLKQGELLTIGDLIFPLLLESSNDAAEVIAEYAGRSFFIHNMNGKAKSIGLDNTSFEDPSGLSQNNVSTASDLFKLMKYIHDFKSYILDITLMKEYELGSHIWYSNSKFRNDDNYLGGKNGYTDEALHTLISTFDLPLVDGGNREIAIILLYGDDTEKDTRNIIKYLLSNVEFVED